MNDEKLFEMLDQSIAEAVELLSSGDTFHPFAVTLEADDTPKYLNLDEPDHEKCYTMLLEALRAEAKHGEIKACALLARVTIPDSFGAAVPEGIRVHVEERASAHNKLAARFLYIPYQLYRTEGDDTINVHLHNPIPVGFPSEIFV